MKPERFGWPNAIAGLPCRGVPAIFVLYRVFPFSWLYRAIVVCFSLKILILSGNSASSFKPTIVPLPESIFNGIFLVF
jgi:hypothetical protein